MTLTNLPGLMICLIIFDRHESYLSNTFPINIWIWISTWTKKKYPILTDKPLNITYGCVYLICLTINLPTEMHGFATPPGLASAPRAPQLAGDPAPIRRTELRASWQPNLRGREGRKVAEKTSKNHGFVGFQQQKRSNILGFTSKT